MTSGLTMPIETSINSVSIRRIIPGVFEIASPQFADCSMQNHSLLLASEYGTDARVVMPEHGQGIIKVDKRFRDAKTIPPDRLGDLHKVIDVEVSNTVTPALEKYFKMPFKKSEGAQIVRYSLGGKFAPHTDSGALFPQRYMTLIKYINDDYSGGETEFFNPAYSHKGTRNNYLIFYSEMLHASRAVLSGDKFVFVTWYVSDDEGL